MAKRYVPGITPDRRKRQSPDIWSKTLRWLGVVSWVLMFFFLAAKRQTANTVQAADTSWAAVLGQYIFYLMILGLIVSVSGFMIIKKRNRRRTDEFTYSVLVLGLVSFCGIIYYLVFG